VCVCVIVRVCVISLFHGVVCHLKVCEVCNRVAKTHKIHYLDRSFSAKEHYN